MGWRRHMATPAGQSVRRCRHCVPPRGRIGSVAAKHETFWASGRSGLRGVRRGRPPNTALEGIPRTVEDDRLWMPPRAGLLLAGAGRARGTRPPRWTGVPITARTDSKWPRQAPATGLTRVLGRSGNGGSVVGSRQPAGRQPSAEARIGLSPLASCFRKVGWVARPWGRVDRSHGVRPARRCGCGWPKARRRWHVQRRARGRRSPGRGAGHHR